jgi:uncharacterized protein YjbI with pentapeptide repeats
VQGTPTPDTTVTTLSKQKLEAEVNQLQRQNDRSFWAWFWGSGATILSTFVALGAGFAGFWRWRSDQRVERQKREQERSNELAKRAEERFQSVVEGLGSEDTERRVGAAIMLRTFLQPEYEQFYQQTFDLAVAHLRLRKADQESFSSQNILSQGLFAAFKMRARRQHRQNNTSSIPLDSLSQALILVFQEAFPRARDWRKQLASESKEFDPHILDASSVQLDNAYLSKADLAGAWLEKVSLQEAYLRGANLHGANLRRADLRGAYLGWTDLRRANLRRANLCRVNLYRADLRGANLYRADLRGANLRGADLGGADLGGADLRKADLRGTNLRGANLSSVDLRPTEVHLGGARSEKPRSANLSEADLSEADLRKAILTGTHPEHAQSLDKTKMSGVVGLDDPKQREECIAKGAIFDDGNDA